MATPEVQPQEVSKLKEEGYKVVDVRRAEEYTGELGHVPGAQLVTLGEDLTSFLKAQPKDSKIVFVCRSGGRSGQATDEAHELGVKDSYNMIGGMILWNELGFEVER